MISTCQIILSILFFILEPALYTGTTIETNFPILYPLNLSVHFKHNIIKQWIQTTQLKNCILLLVDKYVASFIYSIFSSITCLK